MICLFYVGKCMRSNRIHWTPLAACIYIRILLFHCTCYGLAASNGRQTQKKSGRDFSVNSVHWIQWTQAKYEINDSHYLSVNMIICTLPLVADRQKHYYEKFEHGQWWQWWQWKKKHQNLYYFSLKFIITKLTLNDGHNSWHTLLFLRNFLNLLDFLKT